MLHTQRMGFNKFRLLERKERNEQNVGYYPSKMILENKIIHSFPLDARSLFFISQGSCLLIALCCFLGLSACAGSYRSSGNRSAGGGKVEPYVVFRGETGQGTDAKTDALQHRSPEISGDREAAESVKQHSEGKRKNLPENPVTSSSAASELLPQEKTGKLSPAPEEMIFPSPKEKELPKRKVSLRMRNEDIRFLLRVLARGADISIMISENVKGSATLDIQNKPWDQVFLGILSTYGLIYEWAGDIVRVMTVEDMGFEVKKLEMRQRQEAQKREIEIVSPLSTGVIEVHYADVSNLRDIFEKFLEEGDRARRGTVMVDKHTNSLVIRARENHIAAMRLLAQKLDRPTLQIRIEAQIVEANSDTARELGIEWGGFYSGTTGKNTTISMVPGVNSSAGSQTSQSNQSSQSYQSSQDTLASSSALIQKLPPVIAGDSGLLLGLLAQNADRYILGIQLSALEKEGKLRILSNPSISTLDNHTALIESGREVPYQTVEDDEVNIEFKKAVLSLEVTPHVINDNTLKMKVLTAKDELDFSNAVEGNPTVITKKAETNVLLRDGQTMVIGGLRKETESEGESGVPFLKEIPLLGQLFRRDYRSSNLEEILIFITPRIVRMPETENPD